MEHSAEDYAVCVPVSILSIRSVIPKLSILSVIPKGDFALGASGKEVGARSLSVEASFNRMLLKKRFTTIG